MFGRKALSPNGCFLAPSQISSIYELRTEGQPFTIALVLLFITSRLKKSLERFCTEMGHGQYGSYPSAVSLRHLRGRSSFSGNFILIMAALTAGLFWGFLLAK